MTKLVFIFILFASLFSGAYSKSSGDEITPYGVYCPLCGDYGYCTKQPTQKEITNALKSYYSKKGLRVVLIKQDGRFAEAEVYKNEELVDKVLLDCRTGRIMKKFIVIIVPILLLLTGVYAGGHEKHGHNKKNTMPGQETSNEHVKICPVSGDKIDEKTAQTYKYEYKGKIYNFCCQMCLEEFKKDPEKYISTAEKPKFTKHRDNSLFKITDKGLFSVEMLLDGKEFKIDRNDIGIVIHDSHDEDVEGAKIHVELLIHGASPPDHDGVVALSVTEQKGGLYTIKNLDIQRGGNWELRMKIKKQKLEDGVIFVFPNAIKQDLPKGKYNAEDI